MMKHRSIDIFIVITITFVAAALAFTVPPDIVPVRILLLPLMLVLPGYALTSALFSRLALGIPERLVFSLGLSLVIVILGGLLLNLTPFGLRTSSWTVFLSGITLAASAVALVRQRKESRAASGWLGIRGIGFTFRQGLLIGLAALIVCEAIAVSIVGAERQSYSGFTQLWILPVGGTANVLRLGVSNMESTAIEYRLVVNVDGKAVKEWPSIDLNPNEKWQATLVLPQARHVGSAKVEAMLYRVDAPNTIYRHVVLWLGT